MDETRKDESYAERLVRYFKSKGASEEEALIQTADIFDRLKMIFEELNEVLKDERKMKELREKWKKESEERIRKLKHYIDEMQENGKLIVLSGERAEEALAEIKEYAKQKGAEVIDVRGNLEETKKIVEELYYRYDSDKFANKIVVLNLSDFNEVAKSVTRFGDAIDLQGWFATDYLLGLQKGLVIIVENINVCWYGGKNAEFNIYW